MLHKEPKLLGKNLPNIYITITGGGTGIIPKLLENGGASSYFIGVEVPYSSELSDRIINSYFFKNIQKHPILRIKLCSSQMAELLALHSETYLFRPGEIPNYLAVGVTASLIKTESERPDRINEAYACFNLSGRLYEYHWAFSKEPQEWINVTQVVPVTREYQEKCLVSLLYKTLVEIIANEN